MSDRHAESGRAAAFETGQPALLSGALANANNRRLATAVVAVLVAAFGFTAPWAERPQADPDRAAHSWYSRWPWALGRWCWS